MTFLKHSSIVLLLFIYCIPAIQAKPVDVQTAGSVGFNFLSTVSSTGIDPAAFKLLQTEQREGINLLYVFGYAKGFVIVAADDRVEPILGYSNEGRPFIVPEENDTAFGNNFQGLMNTYKKVIAYVIENNLSGTADITQKWLKLENGSNMPQAPAVTVAPLLTTTWGQGWPYNSMCPADPSGPGGHVWVGCVGTAIAQILKFWSNPAVGLGSFSYQSGTYPVTSANFNTPYNWANMPNSTAAVNTDISTIAYHSAVSTMSQWGAGGTSVIYYSGEDPMTRAFKNDFKMASSTMQYMEKAGYSTTQWDTYLQTELVAGRPIYYSGDGTSGHAWVCDGVDNANLYHFNFGWDGNYNGYYSLGNINPGGNVFTNNQQAIMGIKPNDGSTLVTNTTWSSNMTLTTNVWVPDSITLTINAGAVIKFAPGCGLYVFGRLVCNGTSTNYVKLTASDTTNGWNGVRFDNNYLARLTMADNDTSKMMYTQVEYSHASGVTCVAYGKLILDHCKINNNHGIYGAGISVWYIPIKVLYCDIYSNHASLQGGGIFVSTTDTLSSIMDHNNLHDNVAGGEGGGFYFIAVNNISFAWNISQHNYAPNGAGGAILSGTIPLTNNKICNNITPIPGGRGALHLENYSGKIIDMLIANNTANGIFCTNSSPFIANTTIVNNNHDFGSGIVFDYNSDPYIKNCIIYGNVANNPTYGNQITMWNINSDPYFDHCNIQGGMSGFGGPGSGSNYTTANYTNNIDLPNQFVAPSACAGDACDGLGANWNLTVSSPDINIGTLGGIPPGTLPMTDLAGNPRITNDSIDIGAYEYTLPIPVQVTVGSNNLSNGQSACYNATQTIAVAGNGTLFKVEGGGSAEMIAGQNIFFLPGTTVEAGGYLHGYIAPGGPWCSAPAMPAVAATVESAGTNPAKPGSASFTVYPNPTGGAFTLALPSATPAAMTKVTVYGTFGEKILEAGMTNGSPGVFSLAGRPSGVYYIRVETGGEVMTGKVVKY
ncbi:MAG: C10 family peptidase [Bacteroidales bacterium]